MDIRFLIVGTPFIVAFFYSLFWLKKWGAFKLPNDNYPKKTTLKDKSIEENVILQNIFLTKN